MPCAALEKPDTYRKDLKLYLVMHGIVRRPGVVLSIMQVGIFALINA